jgi:nitrate/TMAO reductase-like tetraheme cytochrome c subunit
MKYIYVVLFLLFTLVLATGCVKSELPSAFKGGFDEKKNNKVISEYCISCHIHKEFSSKGHIQKIHLKYKRKFFRKAQECRICHYIEKEWSYDHIYRKTRRPSQVNRGGFKKFEKEFLKSLKK